MKETSHDYTVREVSELTGLKPRLLQHYLSKKPHLFPGATKNERGEWRVPVTGYESFKAHHQKNG